MKKCVVCGEEFEKQYKFCPVDGQPLTIPRVATYDYSPTIISDESLVPRLAGQVSFVIAQLRAAWPGFKSNPSAFLKTQIRTSFEVLRGDLGRPYLKKALLAAVMVVMCVSLSITIVDRNAKRRRQLQDADDLQDTVFVNPASVTATESKSEPGNGANDSGRVGFNKGHGEGSGP